MAKGPLTETQIQQLDQAHTHGKRNPFVRLGDSWKNECCSEHNGTVADFSLLNTKIDSLDQYMDIFVPNSINMVKCGTIAAGAVTTAGVIALTLTTGGGSGALAAAAGKLGILGAAGTGTAISSLSGAALTSASLAAVGGSMAAGTAVIAAAGAGLGGVAGGILSNKYVKEDKYLGFHNKKTGGGEKTLFVNGFLQQRDTGFSAWTSAHEECFPREGLYGLSWASKDLAELGSIFAGGGATAVAKRLLLKIGKKGTKKFNPLGPIVTVMGLFANPWHVSMVRAAKTGTILAEAISRSKEKEFNLVGHSLGCRVIYYALETLSSKKKKKKKIKDVILLGGAVGKDDAAGWKKATSAISGRIYNCYSEKDGVLSRLYRVANAGLSHPIGIARIPLRTSKIRNLECTDMVSGHMRWKSHYEEILRMIYC